MESVRGKYKPPAPCPCGAVDEKGNLVEHQRPTHKMCLRNPKRMRTAEPVIEEPIERFTIKVNIDSMFNCDTDFGQRFKDCMLEAIERYNHITFLASKLITLHVIRLRQEQNQVLPLSDREFQTCCNVISRSRGEDQDPTPCRDGPLRITLDLLLSQLPAAYVLPHREGLTQALSWASISWIANAQVDVCYHLSQRLERWIVLRLAADLAQQIPEKGLWRIASRIVETLVWKEKAAFGRARQEMYAIYINK
ncbi:hypothetical protein V1521DRAFT_416985 [Lipomyces starkeyi]